MTVMEGFKQGPWEKDVYKEKPMCMSLEEAGQVLGRQEVRHSTWRPITVSVFIWPIEGKEILMGGQMGKSLPSGALAAWRTRTLPAQPHHTSTSTNGIQALKCHRLIAASAMYLVIFWESLYKGWAISGTRDKWCRGRLVDACDNAVCVLESRSGAEEPQPVLFQ